MCSPLGGGVNAGMHHSSSRQIHLGAPRSVSVYDSILSGVETANLEGTSRLYMKAGELDDYCNLLTHTP